MRSSQGALRSECQPGQLSALPARRAGGVKPPQYACGSELTGTILVFSALMALHGCFRELRTSPTISHSRSTFNYSSGALVLGYANGGSSHGAVNSTTADTFQSDVLSSYVAPCEGCSKDEVAMSRIKQLKHQILRIGNETQSFRNSPNMSSWTHRCWIGGRCGRACASSPRVQPSRGSRACQPRQATSRRPSARPVRPATGGITIALDLQHFQRRSRLEQRFALGQQTY